jgi:hypothetical protein
MPTALSMTRFRGSQYHDSLAYKHVNNNFFAQLYHNRNNQLSADSDQYPMNQHVTSSHSGAAPHSNLVIFMFPKQIPSLRLLSCSIQCSVYSTHKSLSIKSPWSGKGHTTQYDYSTWYRTQSYAPNPSASNPLTLAPAKRIHDVEPGALATEQDISLTLELSLLNYDPYPTHAGCVLVRTVNQPL